MLTFFRKIRKTLLESGSTRRYLLYAIGEIALVVIGILIAVQINNLNEAKIQRNLEQEALARLLEDLQQDADRLHFLDTSYVRLISEDRMAIKLFIEAESLNDIRTLIDLPT